MRKFVRTFALAALVALAGAVPAVASPVTVDAGWYGFCFGAVGSGATAGCQNLASGTAGNTITFTAVDPVLFKITDAFQAGDRFTVDINAGAWTFTTPIVPLSNPGIGNPDLAFGNAAYSYGSILLAPGIYSVDITVAASPYQGGGAYFEVESVPEPASLLLLGTALAGACIRRRRSA